MPYGNGNKSIHNYTVSPRHPMSVKMKLASDLNTLPEECVVPVKQDEGPATGTVKIRVKSSDAAPVAVHNPIKITINDCLMCSGCVTSAEEVFFRELNTTALEHAISSGPKAGHPILLSLSQSAILSLSTVLFDTCSPEAACIDALFNRLKQALRARVAALRSCSYEVAPQVQVVSEVMQQEQSVLMNIRKVASILDSSMQHSNIAIVTHCPAVRLFIMKRSQELAPYIISTASPMELVGEAANTMQPEPLVVSIQPCQDRKIEQFRGAKIDVCLTAQEIYSFLQTSLQNTEYCNDSVSVQPAFAGSSTSFWQYAVGPLLALYLYAKGWVSSTVMDSVVVATPNGLDLQWTKMGNEFSSCTIEFIAGLCTYTKIVVYKSAGYHNLQNLVRRIHAICPDGSTLYVLDLHACPHSCYGGACIAGDDLHPINKVAADAYKTALTADKVVFRNTMGDGTENSMLPGLVEAVDNIVTREAVIRTEGEVVSPEEIARRKGISSAVRVQDLAW